MKNLFNSEEALALTQRVENLTPNHTKKWGKMNAAQMLAHCHIALETARGNVATKRSFAGKLLGGFFKNKLIIKDAPFAKNSPTVKEFLIKNTCDFNIEKQNLLNAIRGFATNGEGEVTTKPHPFFGQLTPQQWAMAQYKHIDYHLTQFSA